MEIDYNNSNTDIDSSTDYEELYNQALSKIIDCNTASGLATRLKNTIVKERQYHNDLILLNEEISKPVWMNDIIDLNKVLGKFIQEFQKQEKKKQKRRRKQERQWSPPTIIMLDPSKYQRYHLTERTKQRHIGNVNDILKYKCMCRKYWINELKRELISSWNMNESNLPNVSGWDTYYLQMVVGSSDAHWNLFTSELKRIIGWNIFASKRVTDQLRKSRRIITGQVFRCMLQRGKKRISKRTAGDLNSRDECIMYFVFFMAELEAIAMSIDGDINKNKFCYSRYY